MIKDLPAMQETWVQSLGWEDLLEKGVAIHSSILAWRIPWREKPGWLYSMESQGVGHNWVTNTSLLFIFPGWLSGKESPANPGDCSRVRYDLVTEQTLFAWNVQPRFLLIGYKSTPNNTSNMTRGGNFWTASHILLIHAHCRKCSWI